MVTENHAALATPARYHRCNSESTGKGILFQTIQGKSQHAFMKIRSLETESHAVRANHAGRPQGPALGIRQCCCAVNLVCELFVKILHYALTALLYGASWLFRGGRDALIGRSSNGASPR